MKLPRAATAPAAWLRGADSRRGIIIPGINCKRSFAWQSICSGAAGIVSGAIRLASGMLRWLESADRMAAGMQNWISRVPLRYVVAAMAKLPPCGPAADRQHVDVDAGAAGRFRITFTC